MSNSPFKFAFDAVYYHAKDMEKAIAFYRDVLGLRHLFTAGKLAFFDCGGVRLMLEDRTIIEIPTLHNDSVLYFRVPDIHAA